MLARMTTRNRRPLTLAVGLVVLIQPFAVVTADAAVNAQRTLRVTGIDRTGQPQDVEATVVNVATKQAYKILPGSSKRVAAGTYAISTRIGPPVNASSYEMTVAARTVKVSQDLTVTFDARQGQPVAVGIQDDTNPTTKRVTLQPVLAGYAAEPVVAPSDAAYVVPDASKHVRLFGQAVLSYPNDSGVVRYDLVRDSGADCPATSR